MIDPFIIDSAIFVLALALGVALLWRSTREDKGLRPFGLLYIASTFSSYNMMVAPVHDYNLVVARTFMTHAKVIGPLSPLDVLMVAGALYACTRWLLHPSRLKLIPTEFQLVFAKDALLTLVSLALFLTLASETGSPLGSEIAWYRQGIYYIALFAICGIYLERRKPGGLIKVFTTFLIIDCVNFAAGYFSTLVYGDLVWQRYFFFVTIIDQDDVMIAVTYAVMLIYMWTKKSTYGVGKGAVLASTAITVLLLANFYKGAIGLIVLSVPFMLLLAILKRQDVLRPMLAMAAIVPFAALFVWIFAFKYATTPLDSRQGQFVDLAVFMNNLGSAYSVLGIGNGTLYTRNFSDEDRGEVKMIDLEETGDKASFIQTPVAQVYKATGIAGLALHLLVFVVASTRVLRRVIVEHPISVAAGYLVCIQFLFNFFFIDPTGTVAFLIAKLFIFTSIARHSAGLGTLPPSAELRSRLGRPAGRANGLRPA